MNSQVMKTEKQKKSLSRINKNNGKRKGHKTNISTDETAMETDTQKTYFRNPEGREQKMRMKQRD